MMSERALVRVPEHTRLDELPPPAEAPKFEKHAGGRLKVSETASNPTMLVFGPLGQMKSQHVKVASSQSELCLMVMLKRGCRPMRARES